MACDDSLKGCMRSSHVHHGLTLASAAPQVASALAHLGAVNPPSSVDDAYALVGSKGAATPLAEARTACCDNPQPVCKTCDDTQATVTMYVACGERAEHAASALGEVRVRLQEHAYQAATPCTQAAAPVYPCRNPLRTRQVSTSGTTDVLSEAYVFAVGDIDSSPTSVVQATAPAVAGAAGALAALQASDVDVLDAACDSALSSAYGDRMGARLTPAARTDLQPHAYEAATLRAHSIPAPCEPQARALRRTAIPTRTGCPLAPPTPSSLSTWALSGA